MGHRGIGAIGRVALLWLALAAFLAAAGCGGSSGTEDTTPQPSPTEPTPPPAEPPPATPPPTEPPPTQPPPTEPPPAEPPPTQPPPTEPPPTEPPPVEPPPPPGGTKVEFGTAGPWPVENAVYGRAQGLQELPVVGFTTDEAQNRWVATPTALYLFRPGAAAPVRFTAASGLHLMGNPPIVNDADCLVGSAGPRARLGGAVAPGIATIVGGAPGEVFVGYHGVPPVQGDCHKDGADPAHERHSGKIDFVRLAEGDALLVDFMDFVNAGMGRHYYENRGVKRLIYDHFTRPGDLYAGFNHGVDLIRMPLWKPLADWRALRLAEGKGTWEGDYINEWMGDHLHAEVCYPDPCPPETYPPGARFGDWYGLALDPAGDLWHAGKWAAGLITWDPDPSVWWKSPRPSTALTSAGQSAFEVMFGRAYPNGAPPVFVPQNDDGSVSRLSGEPVSLSAVTVTPDGRTWFASEGRFGLRSYGIASWRPAEPFRYYSPVALGFPDYRVRDLVALPDGRLAVAHPTAGVVIWNPDTNDVKRLTLPSNAVEKLELDTMVNPPTLHVATGGGAAAIRVLP